MTHPASDLFSKLYQFVPYTQRRAIAFLCQGEEGAFFVQKMQELQQLVDTMPKTYEQDGKGDDAVAYLHYFRGGCDWYITEKDMEPVQHQAYGLADLGHGGELGYISLQELIRLGVELDLYFKPATLGEIKKARS